MNNQSKSMRVVVIGGGNGSALTLRALKKFSNELELSGVISMSDSGGSTGRLRREFNTLPSGDILRAVLALSKHDYKFLKKLFHEIRFSGAGKLSKHNLGNLFLVLVSQYDGSWLNAISALEQAVEAKGHIYPVTLDKTDLCVELTGGEIVKTEGIIDRPDYDRSKRIKKAWLEPAGGIYLGAKKAIEEADYIFLGPGSLYCSIVATLLPEGVRESLEKTKAKLVYIVGNAYELSGETGPVSLSNFITELEEHLPRPVDSIIYNNFKLKEEQVKKYEDKGWALIKSDLENVDLNRVIQGDYERESGGLDDIKLGKILKSLIK